MNRLKRKTEIKVCGKCGCYLNNGEKWKHPTEKSNFDLWLRGQMGEQWEVIYTQCPLCEAKRSADLPASTKI